MPCLLLLKSPWTYVAVAFALLGSYAAVQHIGWQASKAELAQFRADVESEGAKAKVAAAQAAAQQAQHEQEALDDLQTRNAALSARYASLRAHPGSRPVSALPEAAAVVSTGPVSALQPDPDAGCLAAFEWADQQLAKYAEVWRLELANAAKR